MFDVTQAANFYGEGGSYHKFAGKDASRALGKSSLEPADIENSDLSDLTEEEKKVLDDWFKKYTSKYEKVGRLVQSKL